jgi:cobalamin biosynthesis protein CbiG
MKTLSVGIGCRSRRSAQQIEAAVRQALAPLGALAFAQIHTVASIDSKVDEPGLREFCARHGLPLTFFSREQIAAWPVDRPSAAAREHAGVDGVCEPCALLAAQSPTATACLIVRKTIVAGVTVAIASSSARAGPAPLQTHTRNTRSTQQDLP